MNSASVWANQCGLFATNLQRRLLDAIVQLVETLLSTQLLQKVKVAAKLQLRFMHTLHMPQKLELLRLYLEIKSAKTFSKHTFIEMRVAGIHMSAAQTTIYEWVRMREHSIFKKMIGWVKAQRSLICHCCTTPSCQLENNSSKGPLCFCS